MTDFGSIAELRADLQRQDNEISDTIEASVETIEAMKIERRIVAARRETLDQAESIQAAAGPTQPELTVHTWVNGVCEKCDLPQPGYEKQPPRQRQEQAQGNHLSAPQNQAVIPQNQPEGNHPRQRQDVRVPVLALLRECRDNRNAVAYTLDGIIGSLPHLKPSSVRAAVRTLVDAGEVETNNGLYYIEQVSDRVLTLLRHSISELTSGEICAALPDLKVGSVIAALRAAVTAGTINTHNDLYWYEGQPSRDDREERRAPVGGDPPALAVPSEPVARDYRATEPDPRTLTDTSPESQAKAAE